MKKVLSLVLVLCLVLSLCACSKDNSSDSQSTETDKTTTTENTKTEDVKVDGYEIALVTDVGNIDDKSFNQGAWEGVKAYADNNGKTYNYYRPSEDSTEARVETIKAAIDKGAKVVVCPGYLFEDAIFEVQDQFTNVQFLLLDGEPHSADYAEYKTANNTHNILYQEEQAGYLAGYAAVMEGYTKLGFLGGMAVPAVIRYGYGFVQGANAAAEIKGNTADISMKYWYCGSFAPSDDIKTKMAGWYTDGTEVIFSCGGGIYLSATAAAEAANAKVIGVDVDQSAESATIITSAMKELANSVVLALTDLYKNNGTWPAELAGKTAVLGAADACVGLPTATWSLKNFTVDQYKSLFEDVKSGKIAISNATDAAPAVAIAVDYQE